jgi:hypothetical protein
MQLIFLGPSVKLAPNCITVFKIQNRANQGTNLEPLTATVTSVIRNDVTWAALHPKALAPPLYRKVSGSS